MLEIATALIICFAVVNLLRMTLYLVGADLYTIRWARYHRGENYQPQVSVVVPAHNEGPIIERTLNCLMKLDYPNLQIILADDGSTDDTLARIYEYKREHDPRDTLEVFTQPNGGKADALNNAIRAMATGELIMCLDGDSIIAPDAVTKSVAYFRDPRTAAAASNVNIIPNGTVLGLVQRYEYLISYHMKKAQNFFNVEYIIGGIGSIFRRSILQDVGFYDTNTMTEDIDLTLKIISQKGNRHYRIAYAADAITYTEAVPSFRSLIRQRYRWKYGRLQAFYKNWRLFFSMHKRHGMVLSWFFLPYALWQEVMYTIEPLIVTFVVGSAIYWRSPWTLISALLVITAYIVANVLNTAHLSGRDKLVLTLMAPLMYVFLYLLSVVEYVALVQAIISLPKLRKSISAERVTWGSPERSGAGMNV
jgi:biofilm PGA synthesis N-glycosyltransferase PgaC